MTTATMNKSDLMAPPVAQTIQQRSLIIGVAAAALSVVGAFVAPDSFYSAYLTGYMFWPTLDAELAKDLKARVDEVHIREPKTKKERE